VRGPDAVTERLRRSADVWHDAGGLSDSDLAERISLDGIDILIDLSMHTAEHRLLAFARKPAPLQGSWLAYAGSSGVETIDFRITDAVIDPDDARNDGVGEEILRMPDCWCCYAPLGDFPMPGALPAERDGIVTFGALNQFGKLREATMRNWAELLARVPNSRLLMVCPMGEARENTHRFFAAEGVPASRLELVAPGPWDEYIRLFHRMDIALDTFPFNGMTTTCHAMWMGVPVVTLAGAIPVARTGLSLLRTVGLAEWAAANEREYVEIATKWAGDIKALSDLRAGLRPRMQSSPLMDGRRFAEGLENAYRRMWRRWCEKQ
jgi:predicted O-linked N-acetylglucosamine transferase (SPINDLY family)